MKTSFIVILLMFLPILASAQFNNQMQNQARAIHQQMNLQNQKWASERAIANQQWQMRSMMSMHMNRIQTAESKLAKEEKNKKKLEDKTAKLDAELKTNQEKLTTLKNNTENSFELQKEIEKSERKVTKSEEKLNKSKGKLETSSKEIENLKKQVETYNTEKEELEKKREEEKKAK